MSEKESARVEQEAWLRGFRAHRDGDLSCEHGYEKGDHHWESGDCLSLGAVPECNRRDNHSHVRLHLHTSAASRPAKPTTPERPGSARGED